MPLNYEQLQSISDAVPALISFVDSEYRYRMCNLAYTSWFGLPREQVIGRTMQEVLGDVAWKALRPRVDAALAGEAQDFEAEAAYLNGVRQIHAVYTPQRGADGRVSGLVILVTDITARRGMEAELLESEERFSAFVRTTSDVVYRMSPDWSEMRQLLGRDFVADTVNPSRGWLEKYIHPDDRTQVLAAIERAIQTRSPFEMEHRVIRADGSKGWTFSRAVPLLNEKGEIREWMGSASDITERHRSVDVLRESEERYRSLFASIDEGFCVIEVIFDQAGRPVDYRFNEVNPAFEKQAGMHDAPGRRMLEFVDHIESHWLENYGRVALTGEPIRFAAEYRSLNSWFDVYAFRVGEAHGRKVAVLFNNITDRKLSEIALREAKEQAERASRAKDEFLAQLSHELRTPLTPVLMTAQAMKDDLSLPAHAREQLEMIARNVALEARIIDDLLDLTRITHGKLVVRTEECDVHMLLNLVEEILREEIRAKQITLTVEARAVASALSGDPARLQQLFWNLLRNAVKFTPQGGKVCIRTFNREADSSERKEGALVVEVSDNGIGFDRESATRLFEPFERGQMANDHRFPGLGLGLAIAKAIVGLHGGTIRGESQGQDRGATFTVEFSTPHRMMAPHKKTQGGGRLNEAAPAEPSLRLLIVDDHAPTLAVIAGLLRRNGHRITTASSVGAALTAAGESEFDLVLSDLGLPDGTGIELMTQLRERHGLRGIALSGYGMEEDMRRSAEAGFVAHLVKPVDLKEVRRLLEKFGRPAKV